MYEFIDKNGNISANSANVIVIDKYGLVKQVSNGGGGGSPTGPAGGDLSGTYPNPSVRWNNGTSTYNLLYYPLTSNPAGYLTSSALTPYLTSAIAATTYFPIPTGTTSQYIRGDGSLATFPTIPSGIITGSGTVNTIPKWTSSTNIGNSFITEDIVGTVVIANNGRTLKGGNTVLSIQRVQTQIDFVLGNPGSSQPNILWSDNTIDGLDIYSTGRLAFRTGGTNIPTSLLGLVQLSTGQIQLTQTPATGTTSDFILLRDSSGNVKQIAYPTIPSGGGTVTSIATTGPITGGTITTSGTIGITQATTSTDGYLSATDWNIFNNKQNASSRRNANNSTNNNVNYCGYAPVGSAESAAVWTITRITIAASGSITTGLATNVAWTNRESIPYT